MSSPRSWLPLKAEEIQLAKTQFADLVSIVASAKSSIGYQPVVAIEIFGTVDNLKDVTVDNFIVRDSLGSYRLHPSINSDIVKRINEAQEFGARVDRLKQDDERALELKRVFMAFVQKVEKYHHEALQLAKQTIDRHEDLTPEQKSEFTLSLNTQKAVLASPKSKPDDHHEQDIVALVSSSAAVLPQVERASESRRAPISASAAPATAVPKPKSFFDHPTLKTVLKGIGIGLAITLAAGLFVGVCLVGGYLGIPALIGGLILKFGAVGFAGVATAAGVAPIATGAAIGGVVSTCLSPRRSPEVNQVPAPAPRENVQLLEEAPAEEVMADASSPLNIPGSHAIIAEVFYDGSPVGNVNHIQKGHMAHKARLSSEAEAAKAAALERERELQAAAAQLAVFTQQQQERDRLADLDRVVDPQSRFVSGFGSSHS